MTDTEREARLREIEARVNEAVAPSMAYTPLTGRWIAYETLRDHVPWLLAECRRLEAALQRIKDECGVVCAGFELCDHPACNSSATAWLIADGALNPERSSGEEADRG